MRRRLGALTVLLALACNEILGLDAGTFEAEGGGGSGGKGGSTPAAGNDSGGDSGGGGSGNVGNGGAISNGGAGGTSGADNSGGEAGDTSCATTADCIEHDLAFPPHLCLAGACVDVLTEECDTVLGAEWLAEHPEDQAIVFGALADDVDEQSASYLSLELAMRELAEHGTLPIDGAQQRPLLLLCRDSAANPDPASTKRRLDHLIDDVGVPGMLLIQSRVAVLDSVEYALLQKEADVFFIDVGATSDLLTFIPDGGRLWHMLGHASGFEPVFRPLVKLVEEHVNPGASNGNGARLTRVVMVPPVDDDGFESVMARVLEGGVYTNGLPMARQDTYKKVIVHDGPITAAIEIAAFAPDIVIDFAGIDELIDAYVARAGIARSPFFILPPSQAHSPRLRERVASNMTLQTRHVGMGFAGPDEEHKALSDAYLERLAAISPEEVDVSGSANVYDAVYFLVYAAVAGGAGGANMKTGMTRLVGVADDARRDTGPTGIDSVLDVLRSGQSLSLHGALGPPDFDPVGGRRMVGSVWCIDEDLEYVMDALRLGSGEVLTDLVGTFPCFYL